MNTEPPPQASPLAICQTNGEEADDDSFVIVQLERPPAGSIHRGATLNGKGWVIAERDVREIALYLDEDFLCYAAYGLARPEIARAYPHFPQAAQCGFSFSAVLGALEPAPQTLSARVRLDGGATARRSVAIAPTASALAATPGIAQEIAADLWPIRIYIEQARVDARSILRVQGWVACLTGLRALNLFLGEAPLGEAETGLPRPDVAADHPRYPNAALSGFRLVQDIAALGEARPIVRIEALAEGGIRRLAIAPIEGRADPDRRVRRSSAAIDICCDHFAVRQDGTVIVEGWVVAAAEIASLTVSFDGVDIGVAETGLPRPDIGNRFPRLPGARRAGFRFVHRLERRLNREHLLGIIVRSTAGETRELALPVQVEAARAAPTVADAVAEPEPAIRYSLDQPLVEGDSVREPLRGVLTISGWAVVAGGLAGVDVAINERQVGPAYVGMRREDVAAAFPDSEDALLSGFALTVPHRLVGAGDHAVRVTLRGKDGAVAEREFRLVSEPAEEVTATALRRLVPQAELDLKLAVLDKARQGGDADFLVVVRPARHDPGHVGLRATLDSLRRQALPHWGALVLADDAPAAAALVADDDALAGRVLVLAADAAGEPTAFARLGEPSGPAFLTVLGAGDRLGADALLEFALEAALGGDTDGTAFLYADERRYDPSLGVVQPFLKPDWSPELLMSAHYIGRPWAAAGRLIAAAGLTLAELAGDGEYDAVLRLTERAGRVAHLPRILCDRAGRGLDPPAAERRALHRAASRAGVRAAVLPGRAPGTWRVRRAVSADAAVSIVMPTCAASGLIETTIRTIRETTAGRPVEIIVVDNIPATKPDWKAWVRQHADIVIATDEPFNWSRFNNLGAASATGGFLLFLNDDMEALAPGWLDALLEQAQRPEIGVVGAQLLYPDGKVQHAGLFLDGAHGRHAFRFAPAAEPGSAGLALTQRNVAAVTGACMMMRRAHFDAMGGFDEAHSVINNDLDFCLRSWRNGQRVVFTPFAVLTHHELASRAKLKDTFDETRFAAAWQTEFAAGDPFFHPLLSTASDEYVQEPEPAELVFTGHPLIGRDRVRSILAIKVDHIGDFIAALPALARLKQRFPGARLTVLAAKASVALARLEPAIDEVIEFNFFHARSGLGEQRLQAEQLAALEVLLAARRFDLALDLRMQPDTRHLLQRSGAAVLAGYDVGGRFAWLDIALEWEGDIRLEAKRAHVTDKLLRLVETVSIACEPIRPALPGLDPQSAVARLRALPAFAAAPADLLDRPLVCIHPGAGSEMKEWPLRSYAALIDLLAIKHNLAAILIGGPDEALAAAEIIAHVADPAAVFSAVSAVSLADLPVVMQACRLYVGNDSGPKHMAAALGVPTLGVHSSNIDAMEWGPMGPRAAAVRRRMSCGPCYISVPSDCHRGLTCIKGIRAGDVYRAARLMLASWEGV